MNLGMAILLLAGDFGENFRKWIEKQALGIAIGLTIIVLAVLIAKRAWAQIAITLVIGAIIIAIIANPSILQTTGKIIIDILMGEDTGKTAFIRMIR
jgi:hypothetical protein